MVLEDFSSVIYHVRFRRYSDQDFIFIESDIINYTARIRMGSKQKKQRIT